MNNINQIPPITNIQCFFLIACMVKYITGAKAIDPKIVEKASYNGMVVNLIGIKNLPTIVGIVGRLSRKEAIPNTPGGNSVVRTLVRTIKKIATTISHRAR